MDADSHIRNQIAEEQEMTETSWTGTLWAQKAAKHASVMDRSPDPSGTKPPEITGLLGGRAKLEQPELCEANSPSAAWQPGTARCSAKDAGGMMALGLLHAQRQPVPGGLQALRGQ